MLTKNVLILLSNFVPFAKRDLFLSISLRLMISLL